MLTKEDSAYEDYHHLHNYSSTTQSTDVSFHPLNAFLRLHNTEHSQKCPTSVTDYEEYGNEQRFCWT